MTKDQARYHRYYLKNREAILAIKKKRHATDPSPRRNWRYRALFGITLSDYNNILESQNGRCAIRNAPPNGMRLAVDHCHSSGRVRGLLYERCNRGLGCFKDNTELLHFASVYLTPALSISPMPLGA